MRPAPGWPRAAARDRPSTSPRRTCAGGTRGARRLALEDLAEQVVGDRALVAGEPVDERPGIRLALERDRGEAQPGRPALRPRAARRSGRSRGRQLRAARRTRSRVNARSAARISVRSPVEAETVEPEVRVGARRDDEPDRARRVRDAALLELAKDDRALELLDVVEHEDHRGRSLAEPLNEPNDRVVGARVGRQRADPLERELHPEPELWAPVVVPVDREPATSSRPAPTRRAAPSFPCPRGPRRASPDPRRRSSRARAAADARRTPSAGQGASASWTESPSALFGVPHHHGAGSRRSSPIGSVPMVGKRRVTRKG